MANPLMLDRLTMTETEVETYFEKYNLLLQAITAALVDLAQRRDHAALAFLNRAFYQLMIQAEASINPIN